MQSTKDYSLFKFRDDNREKGIIQSHLNLIKQSMKKKNLLHLKPILVNSKYEIIDGQHRFMAAKELGQEIFYEISEDIKEDDLILLNTSRAWNYADILHFYCKRGKEEYLKLKSFINKNNLSVNLGIRYSLSRSNLDLMKFKNGEFVFLEKEVQEGLFIVMELIKLIEKNIGFYCPFLKSTKFVEALSILVNHPDFDIQIASRNFAKMCTRFSARVTKKEYLQIIQSVYNYRITNKIELIRMEPSDL